MTARWWLEIGPLKEGNYTGISHVTASVAECMLTDTTRDTAFFFGRAEVPRDIVVDALQRRNGELLEWYVARADLPAAPHDASRCNIAIFPNRKTCRRGFDIEAQIIHDLSTLLTPQFHGVETVDYHALSLRDDVHSNTITFCVSEATRTDVLRYLGPIDPSLVVTTKLAASMDGQTPVRPTTSAEPYVLVLGTIEPRKNIGQVLRFLAEQPHVLRALRFVFLGRYGWGQSVETLIAQHGLDEPYDAGRILFPGYVSEAAKQAMLAHARMLIYPSLFEGFGLPVLEALACGTPCLTTRSSSLPEVGGNVCGYFDPFVPGDFARGFAACLQDNAALRVARQAWAAGFSWRATYAAMTGAIEDVLAGRDGHAG
jgi:glycosyltransferase involved in cell wall biosynthesis